MLFYPQSKLKPPTYLKGPKCCGAAIPHNLPPTPLFLSHSDLATLTLYPAEDTSSLLPPHGLHSCCPSPWNAPPQISPWLCPAPSSEIAHKPASQRLLSWFKSENHPTLPPLWIPLALFIFSQHLSLPSILHSHCVCSSSVPPPSPGRMLHEDRNLGAFVSCPHVPGHIMGDTEWMSNKYILNEWTCLYTALQRSGQNKDTHLNHETVVSLECRRGSWADKLRAA